MQVLQVCPRYFPYIGGTEEHVKNISERLSEKHEVTICTTDPSGRLPADEIVHGTRIRRFKSYAPGEAYYISEELRKYLMRHAGSFDIVHAHDYHALPALYAAEAKYDKTLVFTPHYHGTGHTWLRGLLHVPYRFLGKRIFQRADLIISVSRYEKTLISKHFKIDEAKVRIIPNGISLHEFERLDKVRGNQKSILCVSRLEKYKGIQYLIRVLPRLEPNIVLDIVGTGTYRNTLLKLARRLGVQGRIRLHEYLSREQLLERYSLAHLFVLLSAHEAQGIVVAEALASRTPCIVANVSALAEWVDGSSCFGLEYPIDLDELSELICHLIGRRIERPGGMILWDWDKVVTEISKAYEEALRKEY